MIDLHCHLLPGIDDGAASIEESVRMARTAVEDGVETVAATPHFRADHPLSRPGELAGRVAALGDRLAAESVPIQLVAGGEVDIFWARRATDEELRLVSFGQGGRDLLLETPYGFLPEVFEELVEEVIERGFRVMLGHPERNEYLQRSPRRLEALAESGVLVQINSSSIAADSPDEGARRLALRLLKRGLVHVLASDAHSAGSWRRPELSRGVEAARAQAGGHADWMVNDVPAAILEGAPLPPPPDASASALGRLARRLRG